MIYGTFNPRGQSSWVKGQIFQNAPIDLKFDRDDPYDILNMIKILSSPFRVIKGHKEVKGQVSKNAPIDLKFDMDDP